MNVTAERTVRDVARENPAAPRVFEKFGIDYCCQGDRPLSEACRTANLAIDSVLDALEMAELAAQGLEKQRNWSDETLTDLIWHIQKTHHKYTRDEFARIPRCWTKLSQSTEKTIPNCSRSGRHFNRYPRN